MQAETVKRIARECGFELVGIARAEPLPEVTYYRKWVAAGMAGGMTYLGGRGAEMCADPRFLLASVHSVISVGKLYNTAQPDEPSWISRYAWGEDYHRVVREGLRRLAEGIRQLSPEPFEWKICVDTAPVLERAYARRAGLGWLGKNTCLIHPGLGSWFFLGELLVSLELEPDFPPPDRCGTCTRCVEACPTRAIVPSGREDGPQHAVDAGRCISYLTIENRGPVPESLRAAMGQHVFGCDLCQEVCPFNREAPVTDDPRFAAQFCTLGLEKLAALGEDQFREVFGSSPVRRCGYAAFLRNVAVALGNSKLERFRAPLAKLAGPVHPLVQEHARWALAQLE
jgi:epoxyqueuosine reductase